MVKRALADASPLAFLSARFVIATLALAPLVNFRTRWTAAELRAGLLLAVLLASGFAFQIVGLQYTTPARSAFIVALSSVLAPVIAVVVLRLHMGWIVFVAVIIAGGGIYLLTAPDAGGLNRGDLLTLITAVVFGGHIVAVEQFSKRHEPRRLVWLQIVGTAVGVGLVAAMVEPVRLMWSPGLTGALLFTGLIATALALVWQMLAQRDMSSARASLLLCLEPVFATSASALFWGEEFSLMQVLGGVLILAAMLLAAWAESKTDLATSAS